VTEPYCQENFNTRKWVDSSVQRGSLALSILL
jgi:hypothetical protein